MAGLNLTHDEALDAHRAFLARYGPEAGEAGPGLFVREVWLATPDEWQDDLLAAYGRGERRIAARSAHGVGKTTVAAWMILHQLVTRYPQKAIATAPTGGQLDGALIAELRKWFDRLPDPLKAAYDFKAREIVFQARPKESFFSARTSRAETPEALQGIHCDPGYVLLVVDEASGVAEQVYEAAIGSMSQANAQTILLGNPVRSSGTFFDAHTRDRDHWYTVHVGYWPDEETRPEGAFHSERIDADFAEDVARRYGKNSNAYRVRVLGEFPAADDDTVIPYELLVAAQNREVEGPKRQHLAEVWGVDVARTGKDLNVLLKRNKLKVRPDIKAWSSGDLMETAGRVHEEWKQTLVHERPYLILVDAIGMGAGVADRLMELGLPVRAINVAESASYKDRYLRLRDELWFNVREWLQQRLGSLPRPTAEQRGTPEGRHIESLIAELATPRYKLTSSGKLQVESKDDMRKRGFASPNYADALCLTFAEEISTLVHGAAGTGFSNVAWNQPVKTKRTWVV